MSIDYSKQKRMLKEYGLCSLNSDNRVRYCATCCNYQTSAVLHGEKVCIAYGDNGKRESIWDSNYSACGLYNRPFRSLRPRRRSVLEALGRGLENNKPKAEAEDDGIISLFGPSPTKEESQ